MFENGGRGLSEGKDQKAYVCFFAKKNDYQKLARIA